MAGSHYSFLSLLRHGLGGHRGWAPVWRFPEPKASYDVVVIGAGGHGLAAAYYLAKEHAITRVAVVERGWLGGGNTGRNTTIVRSDYELPGSGAFMDFSLGLWEGLAQELNFNLMFSQRGYIDLAHGDAELEALTRRANAMRLRGCDARILGLAELKERVPPLDCDPGARFPIVGGFVQERGGTARHDAVAWGYARAADGLGVDILQGCPVTAITQRGGRVTGVETAKGTIRAGTVLLSVAGQSTRLAASAGLALPIESCAIQAFVSEPVKPLLDTVVTFLGGGLAYLSQTDKGEILLGGGLDAFNSYQTRGGFARIEEVVSRALVMFPVLSRLRLMRQWAGIADLTMDGSAILGPSPLEGLHLNCGWGYSGFKATPASGWTAAHGIAGGAPHPLIHPYRYGRFAEGDLLDESGAGPRPYAH